MIRVRIVRLGITWGKGDTERLNEAGPVVEVEASFKKCCAEVEKGFDDQISRAFLKGLGYSLGHQLLRWKYGVSFLL